MSENSEREPAGVDSEIDPAGDPTGPSSAGERKSEATPPIASDAEDAQTQVPAPDDDTGGAQDEESRTD